MVPKNDDKLTAGMHTVICEEKAKTMLYDEIAHVLKINRAEVEDYIKNT